MRDDTSWFARSTWSDADAADFAARLEAIPGNVERARCLLAQARTLQSSGRPELLEAALTLFDRLLEECADSSAVVQGLDGRGRCLVDLGRHAEALDAFRASIEAQRPVSETATTAYLELSELILTLGMTDLYGEAKDVVLEFSQFEFLPARSYRSCVIFARLKEWEGDYLRAARWAHLALDTITLSGVDAWEGDECPDVTYVDPEEHAFLCKLGARFPDETPEGQRRRDW